MKLLFYISTIRGGGAARVMVNITNGLVEKGYEICFVTNFPADHEYELARSIRRISLEEVESKKNVVSKNLKRIRGLRRVIRSEQPDVSIAFMGENNFRLILASRGLSTKTIVSVRNDPAREYAGKGQKKLANFLFSKADGIVFQTEDARRQFPEKIQKKSKIIFNQVDEKFFNIKKSDGQYILACGRLSKQKNYPMMLRAFSAVLKEYPNEELRIYGEGDLKEELVSLAKKLGINKSVHFMGFSTDMLEVYKNAKLLLMSSDYEGMPNVLLEAMASSVPVISTDCPCGGPRAIVSNGENGYLVQVNDAGAMANSIITLLGDDTIANSFSRNARESADDYRPKRIIQQWEEYIVKISGL